jgi:hypothetical protein
LHEITQLPTEIVQADVELGNPAMRDARLKAEHNLPYAGCFAVALAQVAPTFTSARAELKLSAY